MVGLWVVVAYLIGALPFALIVGKVWFQKDIRLHGSGNLGTTNTFRILGKQAGIVVFVCDVLKGSVAVAMAHWVDSPINPVWFGLAAVVGHCYSVYIRFQGGKAVATSAGVLLVLDPILFISGACVFFITLLLFRIVSLSSMLTAIYLSIYSICFSEQSVMWLVLVLAVLILYRHRSNWKRILRGEEEKVEFRQKKKF